MKTPILLATFAIATTAAAQPARRPAPPPEAPLLGIEKRDTRADVPQRRFELASSGAWTFHETVGGKTTLSAEGAIDDADLKAIAGELGSATWTIKSTARCMARTTASTVFFVRGKQVYVQQTCGQTLDDASAKALTDVDERVAAAWKKLAAAWP